MARVNFNDDDELDFRFSLLSSALGDSDRARGMLIRFWRMAQKLWGKDKGAIPIDMFKMTDFEPLIRTGWAIECAGKITAADADERFKWYWEACENARKSVEKRKAKKDALFQQSVNGASTERQQSVNGASTTREPPIPVPAPILRIAVEPKGSPESPPTRRPSHNPLDLVSLWNSKRHQNMPAVNLKTFKSGTVRWRSAVARMGDQPLDYWADVLERMCKSSFCRGESQGGGRTWVANFDFFVKPESHLKVLEGKYDDADAVDGQLYGDAMWERLAKEFAAKEAQE